MVVVVVPTDYSLPSAAFANGKTNVFVLNGTYNETADVVIPPGGKLEGESRAAIIDFGAQAYSVRLESKYTIESAGTITVTNTSANVVGVGTTFTNISAGSSFRFFQVDFLVASVADATHLTLEAPYMGPTFAGVAFTSLVTRSFDDVSNICIRNSTTSGIRLDGCRRASLQNVITQGCTPNIEITQTSQSDFECCIAEYSPTGVGWRIDAVPLCTFRNCKSISNAGHGIWVTGSLPNVTFSGIACIANGVSGCFLDGTFANGTVLQSTFSRNAVDGFTSNTTANSFLIHSSAASWNGAVGMNCAGQRVCLSTNIAHDNISYGLVAAGDYFLVSKNSAYNNLTGFMSSGSLGTVDANSLNDSTEFNVLLNSSCVGNIVAANHLERAGFGSLNDLGMYTVTDGANQV